MATKGDQTRARILGVVADMLETHSFDEISIAEITRRADVTRPGFYFYFPTKGAAVATLMEDLFDQFVAEADGWYEHRSDDQPRALREGMAGTVDLWRRHATVMHGMVQAAAVDREARQIWEGWIAAFTSRSVPTLAEDAGARIEQLGLDVEQLAELLVGTAFDAMERDVRLVVETGEGTPGLARSLAYVWTQTLYGTPERDRPARLGT